MFHAFAIIIFAALIHASFQLSVSMLTLLSSHAIGKRTKTTKLLRLTNAFTFGAAIITMLLVSFTALVLQKAFTSGVPTLAWVICCGLLIGLGVAVWIFYYRREKGTSLWIPRGVARYISTRTKATKSSAEAFGLGMSSVMGELIFIGAPIFAAALVLIQLDPLWQLIGVATYTVTSLLTLYIVTALIGSGHKISRIQHWRETNKHFLQFAAGSGLLILGLYLYVDQVFPITSLATGAL